MTTSREFFTFLPLQGWLTESRVAAASSGPSMGQFPMEDKPAELLSFLERTLAGNRAAEDLLFTSLKPAIRRGVVRAFWISGNGRATHRRTTFSVGDCEQQTYLALLDNEKAALRNFRTTGDIEAYVSAIAEHTSLALFRKKKAGATEVPMAPAELPEMPDVLPNPEGIHLTRDLLERVLRILEREMTPAARELFVLHFLDGLDGPEICARTGMSPENFWQWLSRMRKLCKRIADKLDSGNGSIVKERQP